MASNTSKVSELGWKRVEKYGSEAGNSITAAEQTWSPHQEQWNTKQHYQLLECWLAMGYTHIFLIKISQQAETWDSLDKQVAHWSDHPRWQLGAQLNVIFLTLYTEFHVGHPVLGKRIVLILSCVVAGRNKKVCQLGELVFCKGHLVLVPVVLVRSLEALLTNN